MLEEKLDFILEKYFHCKRAEESNPYIRELMVMLPFVSKLRANFGWIRDVLELLLACRVTMSFSRYDWGERIQDVQPRHRQEEGTQAQRTQRGRRGSNEQRE